MQARQQLSSRFVSNCFLYDVIASTWYYHTLNTDAEGRYFPTTELDIVDGYVESVVFMNEVNESTDLEGNKYVVPKSDKLI